MNRVSDGMGRLAKTIGTTPTLARVAPTSQCAQAPDQSPPIQTTVIVINGFSIAASPNVPAFGLVSDYFPAKSGLEVAFWESALGSALTFDQPE
jgi:hypothetical protein